MTEQQVPEIQSLEVPEMEELPGINKVSEVEPEQLSVMDQEPVMKLKPRADNGSDQAMNQKMKPRLKLSSSPTPAFGKIIDTLNDDAQDALDEKMENVAAQSSNVVRRKFPRSHKKLAKKSKKAPKTKKVKKYHYVKQGKACKKIMHVYREKKCRNKKTQKCRSLQKKRNKCKKIIKHKKSMAKRSRKLQANK